MSLQPAVRHTALDDSGHSWFMYAEYPMIRFLEENGYDVSYTSGIDISAAGYAPAIEHTRSSCPRAMTSTGRVSSARTSRPPATRA